MVDPISLQARDSPCLSSTPPRRCIFIYDKKLRTSRVSSVMLSIMSRHIMFDVTTFYFRDMLADSNRESLNCTAHILLPAGAGNQINDMCGSTSAECFNGICIVCSVRFKLEHRRRKILLLWPPDHCLPYLTWLTLACHFPRPDPLLLEN